MCIIDVHMVDKSFAKNISSFLHSLGLSPEEASLYLSMVKHGTSTPLQLSRYTGINRTKVYRTLDVLTAKKLAIQEINSNSTSVTAASTERIEELVRHKQRIAAQLSHHYSDVARALTMMSAERHADTKVRFYRGKSGLEQMIWNVLKARSEVVGYTCRDLDDFVGEKFMNEFVSEFIRRNLHMRDVYGPGYVKSVHKLHDWAGHVSSRYIPNSVLSIPHQMDIYDDIVTFYNWHEGEVFGVEICSEKVALHQKQLFELVWEKSVPHEG